MKKKIIIILTILCIFFGFWYQKQQGIPILGYHGVVSDEDKKNDYSHDVYTLSASSFEKQMKYLKDNGYTTITMEELEQYYYGNIDFDSKVVCLTFDDGLKNFNEVVKPILEKYGYNGTCFVIGKHVEDNRDEFLKSEDIMNDSIGQYYSHSYNLHRKGEGTTKIIEQLSFEEIKEDFMKNIVDSTYFAFPYGRSVEGIETILEECDVHLAFSYNNFRNMTKNDDPYSIPRYMVVEQTPFFVFKRMIR